MWLDSAEMWMTGPLRLRGGRFLDRAAMLPARGLESDGAEGLPEDLLAAGKPLLDTALGSTAARARR